MKLKCDNCRGVFELDERSVREAKGGRVECHYCGGVVLVAKGVDVQAGPPEDESLEALLADICEPGAQPLPLPKTLVTSREPQHKTLRTAAKEAEVVQLKTASPPREAAPPKEPFAPKEAPLLKEAPAPKEAARETIPPPAVEEPETVTAETRVERRRPTRLRPIYTMTRSVSLDPARLVEKRVVGFFPEKSEIEPYRVLRTRVLQAARERGGNSIMITSAFPGEGKTLTAVNLALTFSKGYSETALLVDCDLRRQQVAETLGYVGEKGLGDYLAGDCAVTEMLTWPGVEKLVVISGGRPVGESSELLGSPLMKDLVDEMKGRYGDRYVFFDSPAVLAGADALSFAPLVDHILFVVRAGVTPVSEARRALQMLPADKVLGVVFNAEMT